MSTGKSIGSVHRSRLVHARDVAIMALICVIAGLAHFSLQRGRAIISADSMQYIDNANALISDYEAPSFAYRKPGYSFLLAIVRWFTRDQLWPAIALNHLFLALLPIAAFFLGSLVGSRGCGWVAFLLTLAQVQTTAWGERIMSEPAYACAMSFGLVISVAALKSPGASAIEKRRSGTGAVLWLLAGVFLGTAWFLRPVAICVIAAALGVLVWRHRRSMKAGVVFATAFLAPIAAAFTFECSLNYRATGVFRPCTGTLGAMTLMRSRHIHAFDWPESPVADRALALLPEKTREDGYRTNHVDVWVARHHGMKEQGLSDWEVDRVLGAAGWEMVKANPRAYFRTGAEMFVRALLRRTGGAAISRVPETELDPIVVHPLGVGDERFQDRWFAYWALPHRTLNESMQLAEKVEANARRGVVLDGYLWKQLRYWMVTPMLSDILSVLASMGALWPGIALIFAKRLRLNRAACWLIGTAYVLDAAMVGAFGASEPANARYLWVWVVPDTTLAAAVFAGLWGAIPKPHWPRKYELTAEWGADERGEARSPRLVLVGAEDE